MRDDLHKGCTMGRHWSRTIRLLARDADWSSEGPRAIETAVLRELRRALDSAAVRAVFLDAQQHLLGPGALVPRGTGNELIEMMRGHLEIRHAEGLRGGADRTSPRVLAAIAIDATIVRVGFDEPVRPGPSASARFVARSAPAVPLRTSHIESSGTTTLDVVVTPAMTPDVEYEIALNGVEDQDGNVLLPPHDRATFSGFRPPRPPERRFDLWSMLPKHNRRRDETGDLARFVACLQEVVDLLLADVDRMPREIDLERASERSLDAILRDLGNPFALELDDTQRRRLAASLVEMYRMKGTAIGIRRALAFFLAIEAEILPYASTALVLGESELDHDWELGPSARFARYAFDVRSARALSPYERHLVRQLVEYIKPAHTHFIELIEPLVAAAPDHWELGESDLDETALLH